MTDTAIIGTNLAALSPDKKLDYLRECVLQVRSGQLKEILCPYCGEMNYPTNEFLCCKTFSDAMDAVLHRIEEQDKADFICNVYDKATVN